MSIRFDEFEVVSRAGSPGGREWVVWKGRGLRRKCLGAFLSKAEALACALELAVPAGRG